MNGYGNIDFGSKSVYRLVTAKKISTLEHIPHRPELNTGECSMVFLS